MDMIVIPHKPIGSSHHDFQNINPKNKKEEKSLNFDDILKEVMNDKK